eukprot:scaffold5387_cov251-Ochromonas_danica.AAC.21
MISMLCAVFTVILSSVLYVSVAHAFPNSSSITTTTSYTTTTSTAATTTIPSPRPCLTNASQLGYVFGELSATQSFCNCVNRISDPAMLPTFYNNRYNGIFDLKTSITLNNLELIDEIEGTARLQFSLRMYWSDDRYAMPVFWNQTDELTQFRGLDLTDVLKNQSLVTWMPEIRFPDASSIEEIAHLVQLNASNIFYYARALDIVLVQPDFDFLIYPRDSQTVTIRFTLYNFPQNIANVGFTTSPVLFNIDNEGTKSFLSNQLWSYEKTTYYSYTANDYHYVVYQIKLNREGTGIILRLVVPITMLILLAALSFWASYENRVNITITLLLSVSALSLYLWYVYTIGGMYCAPSSLCYTKREGDNLAIEEVLYAFNRSIWEGIMIFMTQWQEETAGIRACFDNVMVTLIEKLNRANTDSTILVSPMEVLATNLVLFRKCSFTTQYMVDVIRKEGQLRYHVSCGPKMGDISIDAVRAISVNPLFNNNYKYNNSNTKNDVEMIEVLPSEKKSTVRDVCELTNLVHHGSSSCSPGVERERESIVNVKCMISTCYSANKAYKVDRGI